MPTQATGWSKAQCAPRDNESVNTSAHCEHRVTTR